ncbi:unnamed protein product [Merluccius merluccius]
MFDGEPVESAENGSDVITGPGVGEEAGSRVLDHLESMEGVGVEVQVEIADEVTTGEEVADEEEGAKDCSLGDPLRDKRAGG